MLTPEQIQSVDDLGRISRIVKYEANPSGSGKLVQRTAEGGALISGALKAVGGILTGKSSSPLPKVQPRLHGAAVHG